MDILHVILSNLERIFDEVMTRTVTAMFHGLAIKQKLMPTGVQLYLDHEMGLIDMLSVLSWFVQLFHMN
jgi:hypothetical protein